MLYMKSVRLVAIGLVSKNLTEVQVVMTCSVPHFLFLPFLRLLVLRLHSTTICVRSHLHVVRYPS